MAHQDSDEIVDLLRECEESLSELKENQRLVQDGGKAFSELASRLQIEMERRMRARSLEGDRADERRFPRAKSA
ncbi:MAG: hypothetical protein ABJC89_22820 [Acidobacteriota bacterium]